MILSVSIVLFSQFFFISHMFFEQYKQLSQQKLMLSNVVKNTSHLIKKRKYQDESFDNQNTCVKSKRKSLQLYKVPQKIGNVFQGSLYNKKMQIENFKKKNRFYFTSQTPRLRSSSQGISISNEKVKYRRVQKQKNIENQTFTVAKAFDSQKMSKIIHSWRNNKCIISNKNPKIHHERIYQHSQRFIKNGQMIQEPGFINLRFYKNTLQQVENVRMARTPNKRRLSCKKQQKYAKSGNKIKFNVYKSVLTDENPQCRPWSRQKDMDNEINYHNFKSLNLRLQAQHD